jgi:hypothetical protein
MSKVYQDINIKNQDIQALLDEKPGWPTRFGSVFLLLVLPGLFVLMTFIVRKKSVELDAAIYYPQVKINIGSEKSGLLEKIFVNSLDTVYKGQDLFLLKSEGNFEEILSLESKLDSFLDLPQFLDIIVFPEKSNLGILNESYIQFLRALSSPSIPQSTSDNASDISQLTLLVNENSELIRKSKACSALIAELNNSYSTSLNLLKSASISPEELDQDLNALNIKKSEGAQLSIEIKNSKMQIEAQRKKITIQANPSLKAVEKDDSAYLKKALKLRAGIYEWKQEYLILSKENGIIDLNDSLIVGKEVNFGQDLYTLVMIKSEPKAVAQIKVLDFNHLDKKQVLRIEIDDCKVKNYGHLNVQIEKMPLIEKEDAIWMDLKLINGLNTSLGKSITIASSDTLYGKILVQDYKKTLLSKIRGKF